MKWFPPIKKVPALQVPGTAAINMKDPSPSSYHFLDPSILIHRIRRDFRSKISMSSESSQISSNLKSKSALRPVARLVKYLGSGQIREEKNRYKSYLLQFLGPPCKAILLYSATPRPAIILLYLHSKLGRPSPNAPTLDALPSAPNLRPSISDLRPSPNAPTHGLVNSDLRSPSQGLARFNPNQDSTIREDEKILSSLLSV
ncbi:hypothetical protein LXL04_020292 [Taraxacum kok-saghyz]